jgi:hypothetical protein
MEKLKTKDLIGVFSDRTGCAVQHKGCPCNTCFHSIEADFRHICWLIVLGLRGDYDNEEVIKSIRKELTP